ncbi:MAG: chemotaxis protein CheW [Gemmatimonadota bacterium]|nr:chemotaxis protein CheW [Gemmatimonadota bacterium]
MLELEQSAAPADGTEASAAPERRLLLFEIAGKIFACDMSAVREIIPFQLVTRLPGAPSTVCGIINLRGNIVTVLDLGARVGKTPCDRAKGSILLVPYRDRLIGIGVDEVRDLQSVRADELQRAGDLSAFDSGIILGLAEVEGDLAVILDINAIVRDVLGKSAAALGGGES